MIVKRFDKGRITSVEKTPQGYLRIPGYATRVGVFKYARPDGTVLKEYRPADEVFNAESLATLAGIPVTNEHPAELLNSKNTKEHQVGFTSENVKKEGEMVAVVSTITDHVAITDIETKGKRELSCGYTCELDESPGVFQGEPYDVIQRKIIYNHLAVVARGRAGPDVRLRLDSHDAEQVESKENKLMSEKVTLQGKEFEVDPALAAAIKIAVTHKDAKKDGEGSAKEEASESPDEEKKEKASKKSKAASEEEDEEEKKKKDKKEMKDKEMQGKCDSLQARVDHLENELKKRQDAAIDTKAIQAQVQSRVKLEKVAAFALPKETKFDSMSDLELKKEVITSYDKSINLDGKSESYIDGRFDSLASTLEASMKTLTNISQGILSQRIDSAIPDADAARKKSMAESLEAYKQPLSSVKK